VLLFFDLLKRCGIAIIIGNLAFHYISTPPMASGSCRFNPRYLTEVITSINVVAVCIQLVIASWTGNHNT